jgi:hypothetical protein
MSGSISHSAESGFDSSIAPRSKDTTVNRLFIVACRVFFVVVVVGGERK